MSADGNTVIVGAIVNDGNGSNSGHGRVLTWSGTDWEQRGNDIDGETAGDFSGWSVAMSADGNTVIIGAPRNDGAGSNSGHARVHTWSGTDWVQRGNDIDGEAADDWSGSSVAMSADGNTVIIGAPYNDDAGSNSGHARVFDWSGGVWTQRSTDIDGETADDQSGSSVAMSADGNSVIIGAPYNDAAGSNSGHARVFVWSGGVWTQRGSGVDGEAFGNESGRSVAMSADGNTVTIGAPKNNDAGHARVFGLSTPGQAGSDIDGEAAEDNFGNSVAMSADGNTVIIGAPYNDGTAPDAGHARIYAWNGSSWVQRGLDIDGEAANDLSGYSVAMSADGNTVIIGAPDNDGTGTDAGHVRVYAWNGSMWTQRGSDIDGEATNDQFGFSVAMSADGNTVIIGAPYSDTAGTKAGRAHVYAWSSDSWAQRGGDIDAEANYDYSGWSVAMSADGNTVIVGARYNDGSASNSGHARVYTWSSGSWAQRGGDIDGDAASDYSGWSVAMSGDGNTVIIGAPNNDGNGDNAGQARVFSWDGSEWAQRGVDVDGEAMDDQSGWSVASSADGDTVIIGAPDNGDAVGHVRVLKPVRVSAPSMGSGVVASSSAAGSAQLSWTSGLAYAYGPITGWRVEQSTDEGATWTVAVANTASATTTATVSGLSNGVGHRFRVAGINSVGVGPMSTASSQVTPSVPTPPAPDPEPTLDPDPDPTPDPDPDSTPDPDPTPAEDPTPDPQPPTYIPPPGGSDQPAPGGIVAADSVLKVRVPQAAGAKTVFGNLVAERAAGSGFVTAYPCLDGPPVDDNGNHTKSDLNYNGSTPGAVSNRLVTPADTNGDICFYTSTATALIIDINAIADNTITTITNQRTDTRTTNRLVAADTVLKVRVPQAAGAKTVFGNLVAERTAGPGFATAYPCLDGPPVDNNGNHTKSDLNYNGSTPGAVSNRLVTPADTNGDICFYTSTATALIIDINAIADNTITTITNQRTDTRTIEFS